MTWGIEIKSTEYATWHNITTKTVRNVIGAAGNEGITLTALATDYPGALRYKIESTTGSPVTSLSYTRRIIYQNDVNYTPALSTEFGPIVSSAYVSGPYADPLFTSLARVDDEFDVGVGYYWDETLELWQPVRAFGLLIPGEPGMVLSVRITNNFTRPQAFCSLAWSNTGLAQFFSVQVQEGGWKSGAETPANLTDEDEVAGLIGVGNTCQIDFRPEPSDAQTNADNPIVLTATISSYSV